MIFLKSLKMVKKDRAQVALEYFIIFSLVTLLTLLSVSDLFTTARDALQGKDGFFSWAYNAITH